MGKKRIARLILFVVNVVYFGAGLALLVIGSLGLAGDPTLEDILEYLASNEILRLVVDFGELQFGASIYFVCLGSVVIICSIFGSFGTLKKRNIIMYIFGLSKVLMILFNLALIMFNTIEPYFSQSNVERLMLKNLKENFEPVQINNDNNNITLPNAEDKPSANAWARMEFENACCGAHGFNDYSDETFDDRLEDWKISATCCMQISQYKVPTNTTQFVDSRCYIDADYNNIEYVNIKGCAEMYAMHIIVKYQSLYVLAATSFIALEILSILLTAHVARDNNKIRSSNA